MKEAQTKGSSERRVMTDQQYWNKASYASQGWQVLLPYTSNNLTVLISWKGAAIYFSHHSEVERACVRTFYICLLGRGCSHFVMVLHHRPVQPFPVGDPSPCTFAESSLDSSIAQSCFCPSPCGGLQRAMPFQVVKEGQQALITNQQGNSRVVVGPRRVREKQFEASNSICRAICTISMCVWTRAVCT